MGTVWSKRRNSLGLIAGCTLPKTMKKSISEPTKFLTKLTSMAVEPSILASGARPLLIKTPLLTRQICVPHLASSIKTVVALSRQRRSQLSLDTISQRNRKSGTRSSVKLTQMETVKSILLSSNQWWSSLLSTIRTRRKGQPIRSDPTSGGSCNSTIAIKSKV